MLKRSVIHPLTLTSSKICDIIEYLKPTIMVIGAETHKKLKELTESVHHFLLMLHKRMNISVKRYGRVFMTENFGECFYIHSAL